MGAGLGRMKIIDVKTIGCAQRFHGRTGFQPVGREKLSVGDIGSNRNGPGNQRFRVLSGNGELIKVIVGKVLKPLLVGMTRTQINEIWDKAYLEAAIKSLAPGESASSR